MAKQALYTGESPYGRYRVVDMVYNDRPARVLFGGGSSPQSGMATDDNPSLLFEYNQRLLEMIASKNPKRLLVIGGGVFMLPTAAFHRFPSLKIDVIEIDELLVQLARDFFDLPSSPRLRPIVNDGLDYLKTTRQKYDMILLDVFSGYTIPPQFTNADATALYKKHLKRGGVVAMNFISPYEKGRYNLTHQLVDVFSGQFAEVALYQADADYEPHEEQNRIIAASSAPLDFMYLQSSETPCDR